VPLCDLAKQEEGSLTGMLPSGVHFYMCVRLVRTRLITASPGSHDQPYSRASQGSLPICDPRSADRVSSIDAGCLALFEVVSMLSLVGSDTPLSKSEVSRATSGVVDILI